MYSSSTGPGPAPCCLPSPIACDVVAPVMERLMGMQSLINESEDASFLLQVRRGGRAGGCGVGGGGRGRRG